MSLLDALRVRRSQGDQAIPDPRTAVPAGFRGRPELRGAECPPGCAACVDACPTAAIELLPLRLDLGRCVFCGECATACPESRIAMTPRPWMAGTTREDLVVTAGANARLRARADAGFQRLFGRSLRLRQVSAGGCHACELELGAAANVNFDMGRYGIEWVASPRHADGLVLSGALTRTMRDAVRLAWAATPAPRFLVAVGACAISGGLYAGASGVDRTVLDEIPPALYVPGCPPHPLTFVNAILDLLGAP